MAVKSIDIIKSYLTEGKYPTASELVDVLDTLVSICQNSGGSISYSHLELVPDLDAYTEAPIGEIVKYIGQSNNKYTRGWDYEKKVTSSGTNVIKIANDIIFRHLSQYEPSFPYFYEGKGTGAFANQGYSNQPTRIFKSITDIAVGDLVITWEDAETFIAYDIAMVDTDYIYFGGQQVLKSKFSPQTFDIFKNETGGVCYSPSNSQDLINGQQISNYSERVYFPENLSSNSNIASAGVYGIATEIGENGFDIKQEAEESVTWQPIIHPSAPISSGD